jgi:poly(A) polymerase
LPAAALLLARIQQLLDPRANPAPRGALLRGVSRPRDVEKGKVAVRVPSEVAELLRLLSSVTGTYLVGGTVRALFTGEEVKDIDVAVEDFDAAVEALRRAGFRVGEEAKSFRVVKVYLPSGQVVDVAGFRAETYDMVSRKPVVAPARTMLEDASRRDFTFNAMYARVASVGQGGVVELEVEDPFGGLRDLERRVVRTVGDPRVRFMEDPLRMLRAVRFAAKLGFDVDPDTYAAIREMHGELRRVSRERVRDELVKALMHDPARTVAMLYDTGLWQEVAPFLGRMAQVRHDRRGRHRGETVLEHTLEALENLRRLHGLTEESVLAVLLHDAGKPLAVKLVEGKVAFPGHEAASAEIAEAWLRAMRFPNRVVRAVRSAVEHHMRVHALAETMSRRAMARFLLDLGENPELVELALRVAEADAGARYAELRSALAEMLALPRLLSGRDVLSYPERLRAPLLRLAREIQLAQGIRDRNQMLKLLRGLTLPKSMLQPAGQRARSLATAGGVVG